MRAERPTVTADACAASLVPVLERQHEVLQSLLDSINEELCALKENDVAGLENASHQKNRYVDTLNQLVAERRLLLTDAGFAAQAESFESLLRACGPVRRAALTKSLDAVQSLTEKCQQANMQNGQLNAVAQRMVRHLLSHLRGESTLSDVYDRGGLVTAPDSKALGRV